MLKGQLITLHKFKSRCPLKTKSERGIQFSVARMQIKLHLLCYQMDLSFSFLSRFENTLWDDLKPGNALHDDFSRQFLQVVCFLCISPVSIMIIFVRDSFESIYRNFFGSNSKFIYWRKAFFFVSVSSFSQGTQEPVPFSLPPVERLVAIGDLHGDFEKTQRAFRTANLIDENNQWCGGNATAVQVSDLPPSLPPSLSLQKWKQCTCFKYFNTRTKIVWVVVAPAWLLCVPSMHLL